MEKLSLDKKSLRKFGITMGIAFFVISGFIFAAHRQNTMFFVLISLVFFVLAFLLPAVLKPVYIFWMKLAFVLAWINTRIILFFVFYLIFTPTGLIMKLFRNKLLEERIDKDTGSYWQEKEEKKFNPLDYHRQF